MRWLSMLAILGGCYHYSFDQGAKNTGEPMITHRVRRPTYLNGLIGTGAIDTAKYCDRPLRTELRVRASDVVISALTLLIYTPHTLYVTCPIRTDRTVRR